MVTTWKQLSKTEDIPEEELRRDRDMAFLWDAIDEIRGTEKPVFNEASEL